MIWMGCQSYLYEMECWEGQCWSMYVKSYLFWQEIHENENNFFIKNDKSLRVSSTIYLGAVRCLRGVLGGEFDCSARRCEWNDDYCFRRDAFSTVGFGGRTAAGGRSNSNQWLSMGRYRIDGCHDCIDFCGSTKQEYLRKCKDKACSDG